MKRSGQARRVVRVLGVVALLLMTGALSASATHLETFVYETDTSTYVVFGPVTDGEWVVWTGSGVSVHSHCTDIWAARLADRQPKIVGRISDGGGIAVDDGRVLWGSSDVGCDEPATTFAPSGLGLIDLETGEETMLVTGVDVDGVALDASMAAWLELRDTGGGYTQVDRVIMATNIDTDVPPVEVAFYEPTDAGFINNLQLESYGLTWSLTTQSGGVIEILGTTLGDDTIEVMSLADWLVPVSDAIVSGEWIVYIDQGMVLADHMVYGVSQQLGTTNLFTLAGDGHYVFWAGQGEDHVALIGYDLETGSRFTAWYVPRTGEDTVGWVNDIDLSNGTIAWDRYAYETYRTGIHATPLSDLLPSARRVDPGASPHYDFYPESGHTLGWDFRDYWHENGGLPVFGYPLTEEFVERNLDIGFDDLTVQYLERERFEWHPENTGTDYEVLLGRLGAQLLDMQGRDWHAFPKADPSTLHYFTETGHAIAPEFWAYWSSHGLDLNEPGVSYRESVALFGYPLSEPMVETNADGDTVLTQYFERAVFEHHPDNAAPYDVLLRRLGAEMLAQRGW